MKAYTLLIAVVLGLGIVLSLQTKQMLNTEKPEKDGGYLPNKMSLWSSSFRGNTTSMVWDGKVLQFEKFVGGKMTRKEEITPSEENWETFWEEMDEVGIWTWNAEYIDEDLADGHSWEVLLEYGDKEIHSRGRNMYPARFERYEKAMSELQGEQVRQ